MSPEMTKWIVAFWTVGRWERARIFYASLLGKKPITSVQVLKPDTVKSGQN